ncbi:hypothetical protein JY651_28680 [Pyxidicoccus parkwayensis]|uniref:Uncharacterized protein n=1 Tax=Pyxidicoccus parkwayensis TaxID=2813578 RepID=A0ABX7NL08_9BACT|nr:hypothetical protein [Pyxidicoccus parkwaysis]QSQ19308.1 hypothetical protein JY651_28680 [Pyxidicoccus parkwaysis]
MSKPEQVPTVGRVVHYVLGDEAGLRKGLVRPAIIVATRPHDAVNLSVFCDGPNDTGPAALGHHADGGTLWRGSVPLGGPDQPGTWFWPPHVPAKSPAPAYAPPAELVAKAEQELAGATREELDHAARCYAAYCGVTDGRSAVTGAELPAFDACPVLVRAGWLAAARAPRTYLVEPISS